MEAINSEALRFDDFANIYAVWTYIDAALARGPVHIGVPTDDMGRRLQLRYRCTPMLRSSSDERCYEVCAKRTLDADNDDGTWRHRQQQ